MRLNRNSKKIHPQISFWWPKKKKKIKDTSSLIPICGVSSVWPQSIQSDSETQKCEADSETQKCHQIKDHSLAGAYKKTPRSLKFLQLPYQHFFFAFPLLSVLFSLLSFGAVLGNTNEDPDELSTHSELVTPKSAVFLLHCLGLH